MGQVTTGGFNEHIGGGWDGKEAHGGTMEKVMGGRGIWRKEDRYYALGYSLKHIMGGRGHMMDERAWVRAL